MTPTYYLVLSALLFTIGAVGVLVRRNAIVVFMCVELMLNAVNLTLVTFARINGSARRPDHGRSSSWSSPRPRSSSASRSSCRSSGPGGPRPSTTPTC